MRPEDLAELIEDALRKCETKPGVGGISAVQVFGATIIVSTYTSCDMSDFLIRIERA